ncbi:unnamed protein product, partial [Ascophyllum nodosum]
KWGIAIVARSLDVWCVGNEWEPDELVMHARDFRRVRRPASRCRPGGPFEAGGS